ncbi:MULTISPECIES: proline dehydrogenase family protein [Amycolatopsis]|uniref:proline dehydrogenase family protein n=1 Tax=Amycolatopsis TaxID=1813 RepID=UPI000B8A6608|nr:MULTISPECIES: proline dehydrogenase family protein [Amycolatopsis]OXM67428.1 proline dehydrogenase [Amycolatopsis sp. KNN50.9b]
MLRTALLAAAGSPACRSLVERSPMTRPVVRRFVAGAGVDDALAVTAGLIGGGRAVTLDHLGEDTTDAAMAAATVKAYVELLALLADSGLAAGAEVSVKLSAVGQRLPDGDRVALDNARRICEAAAAAGTTVTLDMEDHTTTDATLGVLRELRADFPWVGAVLQAYLRRTEQDCRDLAYAGSRVRLCKGAYAEPASVAYPDKSDVDKSYVRCLRVLMDGEGYPMVATHDPRMIAIAAELGKDRPDWEFQMLYGIRDAEQRRLARQHTMRVYVPYGDEWYGYFMRRLAERPANLAFFLRALVTR